MYLNIVLKRNKMIIFRNIVALFVLSLVIAFPAFAETLSSTNYQIEGATFDGGGGLGASTNYQSVDSIGDNSDSGSSSTNYKSLLGFIWGAYPGIPGTPTLINTGSTLYNSLDFVITIGGNSSDTEYAIAISTDNFVTTNYIQTDNTVGTTAAWQTYTNWGSGSGERVTGLSPSTTYKIKVKARHGADSESGFSSEASATTSSPSLVVVFAGVTSGTVVSGETTTITTTSNAISYGSLIVSTPAVAAHSLTVTTNAVSGYTTTLQQNANLTNGPGDQITSVSGTNASPAAWPGSITDGRFGYHTTDTVLCTGSTNRFSSNNTFAALTTSPEEVACNTSPVTSEDTRVVYKLEIGSLQANGNYQNTLTYITTARF